MYYSGTLFIIFTCCAVTYIVWNLLFLSQRKKLDIRYYEILAQNNKKIIQLFTHITDIKGFEYQEKFQNQWRENIVAQHRQNIKFLKLSQIQDLGSNIILYGKDLALTYVSCYFVLSGKITIGMLFAIQYILGSLNAPLTRLVDFFNQTQLTNISLSRLFEYRKLENEVPETREMLYTTPKHKDIMLSGVSFRYPDGSFAIRNLSCKIDEGKKIGIVGYSGCGKTTLLKIIAGFIKPNIGDLYIGALNSNAVNWEQFRKHISFVMQNSNLIEGTIAENITGLVNGYDESKMIKCVETANIRREIDVLPDGYNTLIEGEQKKMSKGQTQRLLLARSLYKEANIYIFDEATNGLGAELERSTCKKVDNFLQNKTRIYVTHRVDLLKDADSIFVMNQGMIVEMGNHKELVEKKAIYYHLFKSDIVETNEKTE